MPCQVKILFYSQHLVGVGHHFRNTQIVNELVKDYKVFFIDGGRDITDTGMSDLVENIRLPAIFLKRTGLVSEEDAIDEVLKKRKRRIRNLVAKIQPDFVIIEYFPFGRWILHTEILSLIKSAKFYNKEVKIICSLRDIPPRAKTSDLADIPIPNAYQVGDQLRFFSMPFGGPRHENRLASKSYYDRVCPILNAYFDSLLVHGDPQVLTLEECFPWMDEIKIPVEYTGYVSQKCKNKISMPEGIAQDKSYILVNHWC